MSETHSLNPFDTVEIILSNGKVFGGIARAAVPEAQNLMRQMCEINVLEDNKLTPEWTLWGHRIANDISTLNARVLTENLPPEVQRQQLQTITQELIRQEGPEILPYLLQLGFSNPDEH